MLSDDVAQELEQHAEACTAARKALETALDKAESLSHGMPDAERDALLAPVAEALSDWQAAQQRFMNAVERSEAPNVSTAALLLKNNLEVDTTNARCGLPGAHVDGADQPFVLDLTGTRGQALTTAAMEYLDEE